MSICIRGNGNFITTLHFTTKIANIHFNQTNIPNKLQFQTQANLLYKLDLVYTNSSNILIYTSGDLCRSIRQNSPPYMITINIIITISNNTITRPVTLESGINGEISSVSATFNINTNIITVLLSYYYVNSGNISKWTVFDINLIN